LDSWTQWSNEYDAKRVLNSAQEISAAERSGDQDRLRQALENHAQLKLDVARPSKSDSRRDAQRFVIGVTLIAVGGAFAGMALVAAVRHGWDFETVSGGAIFAFIPIYFGLRLIRGP